MQYQCFMRMSFTNWQKKEIDAVATALVEAFISNLEGKGDLEKAAVTIAQGIKDYSTDKRGR